MLWLHATVAAHCSMNKEGFQWLNCV